MFWLGLDIGTGGSRAVIIDAEGVVLVIRSRKTERKDVLDTFKTLLKLGAHFYGFVLNRVDFSKRANSYNYYYYSANYYEKNWHDADPAEIELGQGKV